VRLFGVFEFSPRDEVTGIFELRDDRRGMLFIFFEMSADPWQLITFCRIPPGVIEMKMGVYYDRYFFRSATRNIKKRSGKRLLPKNAVYPGFFFGPFFADPGLDKYLVGSGLDEEAIHVQADAIEFIGRANSFPKNARDDSEHRPSV
jgi:hypothetical protein